MDNCDLNPEFAVICSFIAHFADKIDLELNIEQLKSSIEDQSQLDNSLVEIHIKLLKKTRRYFIRDLWERALIRFAAEYSYEDAAEIENEGYLKTRPSVKLQLLRRLLDAQFECDQKFKAAVNSCEANDLRLTSIGRDIKGNTYWHQKDGEGNFRIYQEQPLDYKYWKAICTKPEELNYLIEELDKTKEEKVKGEPIQEPYNPLPDMFPEYFVKKEEVKQEEDDDSLTKRKPAKTKKGSRSVGKKSSLMPVLEEVEEENSIINPSKHDTIYQNGKENILTDISQINSPNVKDQNSIESQVKTTLESLLNRVTCSLSKLIRPLTGSHSEQPVEQQKKPRKRQSKRERPPEESLPRRSSSRIQQIQQKKIAEQEEELKKIIESANRKSSLNSSQDEDSRSQSTSSKNNKKHIEFPEDISNGGRKRRRKGQSWRRGKGKKKLSWDKDDSDLSSTSTLTESEDDEFEENEETFKYDHNNLDDEFACEDEETNAEPVIIKRARTARQSLATDDQGDLNNSSIQEEDKPCERCDKSNDPEWILLCDMCDDGYHTSCCLPPLMIVPDGDWFCPPCEHKLLITKLREFYLSINELLEFKERERMKRQRLRQNTIKKEPIKEIPEVLPEKRQRGFLSDLNDPLAVQAIDADIEKDSDFSGDDKVVRPKKANKVKKASRRPSKLEREDEYSVSHRKSRKTYSRRSIQETDESEAEETSSQVSESSEELKPKTRRARASVSYRFHEYDELIKSAIKGDSYDEESSKDERESSPDGCNYGRGKDMATIEALAYQQENGIANPNDPVASEEMNVSAPKLSKPRKKSRRLNDLDAASEAEDATSDESFQASSATEAEDEDDNLTEVETEFESDASIDELISSKPKRKRAQRVSYDSDDSEYQPTRTRRAASKRVSYKESSEDEDSSLAGQPRKAKKNVLSSGEESQASWKSSTRESPTNNTAEDGDQSTSCDDGASPGSGLDSSDELVSAPILNTQPVQPVVVSSQAKTKPQPTDEIHINVDTTSQQSFKKVRLERKEQVIMVHTNSNLNLKSSNESIDEIAAPLYHQPTIYQPTPFQHPPIYTSLDHGQPPLSPGQPCHNMEKSRGPIQELIQYCSDSAKTQPASMFNSYTETLSSKSFISGSPEHPSFYEDEDLRPSSSSDNQKRH